jgi:hypothetical protein
MKLFILEPSSTQHMSALLGHVTAGPQAKGSPWVDVQLVKKFSSILGHERSLHTLFLYILKYIIISSIYD